MPTYAATKRGYQNLWDECKLDAHRVSEITGVCERILDSKPRYELVQASSGVPWFWIAATHYRESSLNFNGVLHNGEQIIGKDRETTLVPAGRGPFETWEEAAADVIAYKKLDKIDDWPISRCLYEFERYNGFGYFGREASPYVWAGTTLSDETGKYVRDGVYDSNAIEKQLGCAAILKRLAELDTSVAVDLDMGPLPVPVDPVPPTAPQEYTEAWLRNKLHQIEGVERVVIEYAKPSK